MKSTDMESIETVGGSTELSVAARMYTFNNSDLYLQAMTHKSYLNEQPDKSSGHNERLEFLGDAVLDLSLSHFLMRRFPEMSEGDLSKLRASLVNESAFAVIAQELGLDQELLLGKGELLSGGREKPRLLASVFEAYIGAIYLDAGFDTSHEVILKIFEHKFESEDICTQNMKSDYKTRLQELTQEKFKLTPTYKILEEKGPDHEKTFVIEVSLPGQFQCVGEGRSKKSAEQSAASKAMSLMEEDTMEKNTMETGSLEKNL